MKSIHLPAILFLVAASPGVLNAQTVSVTSLHPPGAATSFLQDMKAGQRVGTVTFGTDFHGGYWTSAGTFFDLHPAGYDGSSINATSGNFQGGTVSLQNVEFAAMWSRTLASLVVLHPAMANRSQVLDIVPGQQVGEYGKNGNSYAAIWSGTAASLVDVTPPGAVGAGIWATTGAQQAGFAIFSSLPEAGVWAGSANSFVNLNPAGATRSVLTDTTGIEQVGYAKLAGIEQAGKWNGTAASFASLHPAGASESLAVFTNGNMQTGYAKIGGNDHAAIWFGTADSHIDLGALMGPDYTNSYANAADVVAGHTRIVGTAFNAPLARTEAVQWLFLSPKVSIKDPKRRTVSKARLRLTGKASGNVDEVTYRNRSTTGVAKGTTNWQLTTKLRRGRNRILVLADGLGGKSVPAIAIVTRK